MKKVVWIVLLLVLAVAGGGAWWVYRSMDRLVAQAIRSYVPEITGTTVALDGVHIDAAAGTAELRGLVLGNAQGFKMPHAAQLGLVKVRLDVASLAQPVVHIQEVLVEAPVVAYEYGSGGSNLEHIQRHVSQYLAAHGAKDAADKDAKEPGKKLIIDSLVIHAAKAEVSAAALNGKSLTVPLADVRMQDIGKKSGGATPAQVAEQVVGALSYGATRAASGIGGVADSIRSGAAAAGNAIKGLFSK